MPGRPCILVTLVLALALAGPGTAVAQDDGRDPSADHLWDAYPLEQDPPAAAEGDGAASGAGAQEDGGGAARADDARPAPARQGTDADPTSSAAPAAGIGAAALLAVAVVVLVRRRRRSAAARVPSAAAPAPGGVADPAAAAVEPEAPTPSLSPAFTASSAPPPASPALPFAPGGADPWCELVWASGDDDRSELAVVMTDPGTGQVRIMARHPVAWGPEPPATPAPQARDTVDAIADGLMDAGWLPLPDGDQWYARRFRWIAPGPPAAVDPGAPAPGARDRAPASDLR